MGSPDSSIDKVLEHFGIKGMHWGVRKAAPSADATAVAGFKKQVKKRGGVQSLSNKELQTLITRMNLEQQLATSRAKSSSKKLKGAKAVGKFLGKHGDTIVSTLIQEGVKNAASGNAPFRTSAFVNRPGVGRVINEIG